MVTEKIPGDGRGMDPRVVILSEAKDPYTYTFVASIGILRFAQDDS